MGELKRCHYILTLTHHRHYGKTFFLSNRRSRPGERDTRWLVVHFHLSRESALIPSEGLFPDDNKAKINDTTVRVSMC